MKCHRDRSHCRLPHHKGRLSAKCNQIQSTAAVLRLEWHTNCFSTTHSESVPRPNSEYKDGRDCPLVNENGSIPHLFRGVNRLCGCAFWITFNLTHVLLKDVCAFTCGVQVFVGLLKTPGTETGDKRVCCVAW